MPALDRKITTAAIRRLAGFHKDAQDLFSKYGMDLLTDLGRRNTLLSSAQEKFFAEELQSAGFAVQCDGKSGQPDIIIFDSADQRATEIECKLTSRNSHGGIIFQTDYATLQRKGSLDYLYVIADVEFKNFAVLYFAGLTPDNFRIPSNGSRGKASMIKSSCYDRCTVLYGGYHSAGEKHIKRLEHELSGNMSIKKRIRLEKKMAHWKGSRSRFSIELESI